MKNVILPDGMVYKIRGGRYRSNRGASVLYKIVCSKCNELVLIYQKDGPGSLVRCYTDRIAWPESLGGVLRCLRCETVLGTRSIYEPEKRDCYVLVRGSFKRIKYL